MLDTLLQQLLAQPPLEWLAVVSAIAYLLLAIRQSVWCWPCAFVSTGVYVYLYSEVALFMESALNVFYLAMAVYGFLYWLRGAPHSERAVPVTRLSWRAHLVALGIIGVLVAVSGWWLGTATTQQLPFVDAATSFSAVWATWLTARKILENWWYWLVIDVVNIGVNAHRGLYLTAGLFVLYVALIPFGYRAWKRTIREQHVT